MRLQLTEQSATDLPAPTGTVASTYYDPSVPGFGLRITPAGVRSFFLDYRPAGSDLQRSITIGRAKATVLREGKAIKVGDWTLREAKARAIQLRREIASGADPQGQRAERKAAAVEYRAAPTVSDLWDRYEKQHLPTKRESSASEDRAMNKQWVQPVLGTKKVADVKRRDIVDLHGKITAAGTPQRANLVVSLLSKMFTLSVEWELRTDNPCHGIKKNPEHARERYLSNQELERLMRALTAHKDNPQAAPILLLLLTGARRSEVLGCQWSEIDLREGLWIKPESHTKQKRESVIPLSTHALELLRSLREKADERERKAFKKTGILEREVHVFASVRRPGKPLEGVRGLWVQIVEEAELRDFRLHDLRHSFASLLVNSGMSLPLIGKLLGHSQVATTQRYAHIGLEAMRAAGDVVGGIVTGAKIAAE